MCYAMPNIMPDARGRRAAFRTGGGSMAGGPRRGSEPDAGRHAAPALAFQWRSLVREGGSDSTPSSSDVRSSDCVDQVFGNERYSFRAQGASLLAVSRARFAESAGDEITVCHRPAPNDPLNSGGGRPKAPDL